MENEIERRQRLGELTEYLRTQPLTNTDQGQHVHIHYHQAPASTAPVDQNPGQSVLDKYTPYFILLLAGCVILAIVAVIAVILLPMVVTMLIAVAVCLGAVAVLALAVSGSLRNMRLQKMDETLLKKVIKK